MKDWIAEQCEKVGSITLDKDLMDSIFHTAKEVEKFCKENDLSLKVNKNKGLYEFRYMGVRL